MLTASMRGVLPWVSLASSPTTGWVTRREDRTGAWSSQTAECRGREAAVSPGAAPAPAAILSWAASH